MSSLELISVIVASFMASGGFWGWVVSRHEKKSDSTKLLMGLAVDKIMYLGMNHIRRGYITKDDYSDFKTYLYEPYSSLGGNGTAKRMMEEIDKLPFYKPVNVEQKDKND